MSELIWGFLLGAECVLIGLCVAQLFVENCPLCNTPVWEIMERQRKCGWQWVKHRRENIGEWCNE